MNKPLFIKARRWFLACILPFCSHSALASEANTFEKTLANGLKVVVKEDHRAPTAAHMVWYRVGAMDEVTGVTGVAHVLEHMMFKGTRTLAPGEFNKRVAAAGGKDNAFTNQDYTAYFQQVPNDKLADMMALEADRMANLQLDPAEFAKEIQVVMEERRMRTDDNPRARLHEALMAAAFPAHPYGRPVIGWMPDLQNMNSGDAQQWYQGWYAPNNAVLVVVGDVDKEQVFAQAERIYGPIASRPLPERKALQEPQQTGLRRIIVKAPADMPYLAMIWKVPALTHVDRDREAYALDVLAGILDGGDAARFAKNLVRSKKIAISAGAGYDGINRGPALFMLNGAPAPGHSVAELEHALRQELNAIAKNSVSADELARVKTQVRAAQIFKRDSMFGQAMEMGQMEISGLSWRDDEHIARMIDSISSAEVQAVAQKYFGDDTLTIGVLEPLPLNGRKINNNANGMLH